MIVMASQRLSFPPANHFNGVILISLLKLKSYHSYSRANILPKHPV